MKKVSGLYIPDNDEFFKEMLEGIDESRLYQQWKIDYSLRYLPHNRRRRAIDIGASVGVITIQLARQFENIECFEPNEKLYKCFYVNLKNYRKKYKTGKVNLYEVALGPKECNVGLNLNMKSTLLSYVDKDGDDYKQKTLDSYDFNDVDFIKIDVEGYELNVLKGSHNTLKKNDPVIMVEHRGHEKRFGYKYDDLFKYLGKFGYKMRRDLKGDYIFTKSIHNTRPENYDPDKPVAILGGGPSAQDLNLVELQKSTNLISLNDSIRHTPDALAFFTIDGTYFLRKDPLKDYEGPKYISLPYDRFTKLGLDKLEKNLRLDRMYLMEFNEDPLTINVGDRIGGTSGRGAFNLAWQWCSKFIILFGIDGGTIKGVSNTHWNRESNHKRWTNAKAIDTLETYRKTIPQLRITDTKVLNASPLSRITCFEKCTLDEALKRARQWGK